MKAPAKMTPAQLQAIATLYMRNLQKGLAKATQPINAIAAHVALEAVQRQVERSIADNGGGPKAVYEVRAITAAMVPDDSVPPPSLLVDANGQALGGGSR